MLIEKVQGRLVRVRVEERRASRRLAVLHLSQTTVRQHRLTTNANWPTKKGQLRTLTPNCLRGLTFTRIIVEWDCGCPTGAFKVCV